MKERPILFSGAMVSAILQGHKQQTRRVVYALQKDRPTLSILQRYPPPHSELPPVGYSWGLTNWRNAKPGDRLWVRETYAIVEVDGTHVSIARAERMPAGKTLADTDGGLESIQVSPETAAWAAKRVDTERWKPSIYMPRWACRLVLEVTAVRVERLQDISEADAIAEGVERNCDGLAAHPDCPPCRAAGKCQAEGEYIDYGWGGDGFPAESATASYGSLWDSLNAERGYGWKVNPYVWVISFRRALGAAA